MDVSVKPLSRQTYGRLQDFWREQFRDDIVKFLRECAIEAGREVTRPAVIALIRERLNIVWHSDTSDLACLIMK